MLTIETEINSLENIRQHKVVGFLNKKSLIKKLSDIYKTPDFAPSMNTLWNLDIADLTAFSFDEIEDVANFVKENWTNKIKTKTAILASDILQNRISQIYAKHFYDHPHINVQVFKTQDEAVSWLKV